jgi:arginine N-succinyltransferase
VIARTDAIRTIHDARSLRVVDRDPANGSSMLVAHGHLQDFAACYAAVEIDGDEAAIDPAARQMLGVEAGSEVLAVGR